MANGLPDGFEIEHDPTEQAPLEAASGGSAPAASAPQGAAGAALPEGFEVEHAPDAAPAQQTQQPTPLSVEEFGDELVKRLNDPKGGNLQDIMKWSRSVGHPIQPGDEINANWEAAKRNRAKPGSGGAYGRVQEKDNSLDASGVGAGLRAAGNMMLFNFGDEGAAAVKAALGGGPGETFGDRYRNNWLANNVQEAIDEQVNRGPRLAGQAAGVAGAAFLPALLAMRPGAGLLTNAARSAVAGTAEGALAGTGSGTPGDRFKNTASGAAIGAAGGAAAPVIARAATAVARPVIDAVASRTGPGGAINALSRRMGVSPQQMADRAAELRASNIEPTVYDVIGETGQDMVGALGRRPTAARQTMQNFADESRVGLQDRVANQARMISPDTRTPDQAVQDITRQRNTDMTAAMEPIRGTPVAVEADGPIAQILQTGEGRSAVRAAAQLERDPETKRALLQLGQPAQVPEGAAEIQRMHDQVRAMGLAPEAEAAALAQLPPIPEGAAPQMTVDMADKIARSFNDAAEAAGRAGRAGRARVLRGYGQEIRNEAATQVDPYREALERYGESSAAADAVRLGESGLARNTDEFVQGTQGINRTPNAEGEQPPDQAMANLGFRRAIERRAGEGPRGALEVAESLGRSREQQARTNALLGEEQGNALARNMANEVDVARSRIRNAPRTGSRTSINDADSQFLEGMANVLAHPIGWKATLITGLRNLSKKGISDEAAGRIVDLATSRDPGAVDAAIEQLSQSLNNNRVRADRLVKGIRASLVRGNSNGK